MGFYKIIFSTKHLADKPVTSNPEDIASDDGCIYKQLCIEEIWQKKSENMHNESLSSREKCCRNIMGEWCKEMILVYCSKGFA